MTPASRGRWEPQRLSTSIAGIAVDNATQGYWLVGANGTLYTFGAPTFGSLVNAALHAPVVGIASTQDGLGYRFVASDGGVFCFGNAHFLRLNGRHAAEPARSRHGLDGLNLVSEQR